MNLGPIRDIVFIRIPVLSASVGVPTFFSDEDRDNWCWAACAQMILYKLGDHNVQQCQIAGRYFQGELCCQDPESCDRTLSEGQITPMFTKSQIHSSLVGRHLAFQEIQNEVTEHRPLAAGIKWNGSATLGHLVVLRGWLIVFGSKFVFVNDPNRGQNRGMVLYDSLVTAYYYGNGSWTRTWREIWSI